MSLESATKDSHREPGFIPPRRKLATDLIWSLSARSGYTVASFFATAIITRLLSPHDVGAYFMMLSMVLMALPIANLSLPEPAISSIAAAKAVGNTKRAYAVSKGTLKLGALSSVSVAVLFVCVSQLLSRTNVLRGLGHAAAVLVALWIAIIAIQSLVVAIFQGIENIGLKSLFDGLAGKLLCVVTLGILSTLDRRTTLNEVIVVVIISELVSALLSSLFMRRELSKLRQTVPSTANTELWSNAWPFLIHHVTGALSSQGDVLVLGLFRSTREVALYGAALRLALFLDLPLVVANVPIAPSIARLRAQARDRELQDLLQTAAAAALISATGITLLYVTTGPFLLSQIFGRFYGQGALLLSILSLGQCANIFIGPSMLGLAMSNEQRVLTEIAACASVIKCIAMLVAAKPFGAIGVAVASALGNALTKLVAWNVMRTRLGICTHARFHLLGEAWKKAYAKILVRAARA